MAVTRFRYRLRGRIGLSTAGTSRPSPSPPTRSDPVLEAVRAQTSVRYPRRRPSTSATRSPIVIGSGVLDLDLTRHATVRTHCRVTTLSNGGAPTSRGPQGRSSDGLPQAAARLSVAPSPWDLQGRVAGRKLCLDPPDEGLDTKTRETALGKANTELRPILAKSPGFVSYELIKPDGEDDAVASVSVFDTLLTRRGIPQGHRGVGSTNLPSMTKPISWPASSSPTKPGHLRERRAVAPAGAFRTANRLPLTRSAESLFDGGRPCCPSVRGTRPRTAAERAIGDRGVALPVAARNHSHSLHRR